MQKIVSHVKGRTNWGVKANKVLRRTFEAGGRGGGAGMKMIV